MENEIAVSVLCSAYNHEKYIRKALEGFVNQKTNFKYEVLIHDDASTDATADIIREYEAKYPNIIKPLYQTENQYSKNGKITFRFQLPRSHGRYIAFCEGDDFWTESDKLQREYDIMESNKDIYLCCHASYQVDEENRVFGIIRPLNADGFISTEDIIGRLRNGFTFASCFFRREVFENYPEDFQICPVGDVPYKIRSSYLGKIYYIDRIMSAYRVNRPGSWTAMNNNFEKRMVFFNKMKPFYDVVDKTFDYKYTDIIKNEVLKNEYSTYLFGNKLKPLMDEKFVEIRKNMSFKQKLCDFCVVKLKRVMAWHQKYKRKKLVAQYKDIVL